MSQVPLVVEGIIMGISQDDIHRTSPNLLADMLRSERRTPTWAEEELGDILRHQLTSPLEFDVTADGLLTASPPSNPSPIKSFGELLTHASPPLSLLEKTKEFAKPFTTRIDGELPREIAIVLYFAAVAAALLRHNCRITRLDDAGIRAGARWARQQPWLDPGLMELFRPLADAGPELP